VRPLWPLIAVLCLASHPAWAQVEPDAAPAAPKADERAQGASAEPRSEETIRFHHGLVSFGGGYVGQRVYGVPLAGGAFEVLAGGDYGQVTVCGDLDVVVGSTTFGLGSYTVGAGLLVEAPIGRVRLGGGVRLAIFEVSRVTESGSLRMLTLGAFARVSLDLLSFPAALEQEAKGAIFLFAKGSADAVGDVLLGATIGAGVRL
jgi:hypothetical protein